MSYSNIVAGVVERVHTVPGLKVVLDYEPESFQSLPAAYVLLDRFKRSQYGSITSMHYFLLVRVCVEWQNNQRAEVDMLPFVNSVAAAIDADPYLNNRFSSGAGGMAKVSEADTHIAGYVKIGGVMYRSLDIILDVLDKAPFQSGI